MASYKWVFISTLKPGDAVIKFDNRYHSNGAKLATKKKGIIIEQNAARMVINWIEGSLEYIYDGFNVEMMVESE